MNIVRQRLSQKGMSRERLAELTGIPYEDIKGFLEYTKEPTLSHIYKIANALDCDPRELVGGTKPLVLRPRVSPLTVALVDVIEAELIRRIRGGNSELAAALSDNRKETNWEKRTKL